MASALAKVKQRLGEGAVILHTRSFTRKGLLGFGSRKIVEITAAEGADDSLSRLDRSTPQTRSTSEPGIPRDLNRNDSVRPTTRIEDGTQNEFPRQDIENLKKIVTDLVDQTRRDRMERIAFQTHVPEELFETYHNLLKNEVSHELAENLVRQVKAELTEDELRDKKLVADKLASCIETILPDAGGIDLPVKAGPTIIALVGPTGVGKTTTVAKLAAEFSLRQSKKVGLITIDTYRVAAIDQLRTYANIIGVPLKVVMSPEDMKTAISVLSDRDVVFIDTAGRSPADAVKLKELNSFLSQVPLDETHLVLSATSSDAVLVETVKKFSIIEPRKVIFTKLDEAVGFGVLLRCLQEAQAQLSYVTTGQNVPHDIQTGAAQRIAQAIVYSRDVKE